RRHRSMRRAAQSLSVVSLGNSPSGTLPGSDRVDPISVHPKAGRTIQPNARERRTFEGPNEAGIFGSVLGQVHTTPARVDLPSGECGPTVMIFKTKS
ncbi:MAG: hypothetical protein WBA25_04030, partial [Jannaschia sp.]